MHITCYHLYKKEIGRVHLCAYLYMHSVSNMKLELHIKSHEIPIFLLVRNK